MRHISILLQPLLGRHLAAQAALQPQQLQLLPLQQLVYLPSRPAVQMSTVGPPRASILGPRAFSCITSSEVDRQTIRS